MRKIAWAASLALGLGPPSGATQTPAPALHADTQVASGDIVRGRCESGHPTDAFTLAHLNDLQAHYGDLTAGRSRYGFIAGYLRAVQAEEPNSLVLDAGDDYEKGSIADLRSLGEGTRRMIQALPIDVRVIGNHDFAYGEAAVLRDVRLSAHPVLAANVSYADGRRPMLPYIAATIGCVRVGIVGLVTNNYGSDDQPNDEPFDGVFVHDSHYVRVLREQAELHRSEVDVLVALTHLGFYTDLELAAQVPDIDVFVGGHSEDLIPNGQPYAKRDGRTGYIFQAGHYGEHVGRADFVFERATRTLRLARYTMTEVDASLPYADDVGRSAHALERTFAPDAHTPITVVREAIEPGEMAKLLHRAVRDRWAVDALMIGKDAFWTGLPSGPVTLQRLFESVPVQREPAGTPGYTSLWILQLTGAQLLELRDRAFSGYAVLLPETMIDPVKTYRLAIDKRALEHTSLVAGNVTLPREHSRFAGEVIDVLEAYARSRTARGEPL